MQSNSPHRILPPQLTHTRIIYYCNDMTDPLNNNTVLYTNTTLNSFFGKYSTLSSRCNSRCQLRLWSKCLRLNLLFWMPNVRKWMAISSSDCLSAMLSMSWAILTRSFGVSQGGNSNAMMHINNDSSNIDTDNYDQLLQTKAKMNSPSTNAPVPVTSRTRPL